jgi:hypothetical protein
LELSAEQGAALRRSASLVERRGKTLDKAIYGRNGGNGAR